MTDISILYVSLAATLLASAIPQILYWINSKKTDEKKRKWELDDVLRDKQIQIVEKRIEEIDKLAGALAKSFHEKRLTFIHFLTNPENTEEIPEFMYKAINNTSNLQKEFYAITPMIVSLDFKTEGLVKSWEKLINLDAKLIETISEETKEPGLENYNPKQILLSLTELKTKFNYAMAKFYDELDSMQLKIIDEFIRFSS